MTIRGQFGILVLAIVLLASTGTLFAGPEGDTPPPDAASSATPERSWPPPAPRRFAFSGYEWTTVSGEQLRGPGPNYFDDRNVWLDGDGNLVLETAWRGNRWTSAHVFLTTSLGYGRYELELAPVAPPLDDGTVFGFFTWDDDPAHANREIDIELARWGQAGAPLLNFVVQPATENSERHHLAHFDPSRGCVLAFEWLPGEVRFFARTSGGPHKGGTEAQSWVFAGSPDSADFAVPPTGRERIGLNLWLFGGRPPQRTARVLVRSFRFSPTADY